MLASLQITTRPLRFALLVDLADKDSLQQAFAINSTVWGGFYNPLVPIFNRAPRRWDKMFRPPKAQEIVEGYIRAFDPDVLLNCTKRNVPQYLKNPARPIVDAGDIWAKHKDQKFSPSWAIGIFDLLRWVFDEHFRFVERFPHKVRFLEIPGTYSLFWSAVFGSVPSFLEQSIKEHYTKALDLHWEQADFSTFRTFIDDPLVIYPHRLTRKGLKAVPRSMMWDRDNLFFMDATSMLDLIDYWNLRAAGRRVIPVPRQFLGNEHLREIILSFLKFAHRKMPQNPQIDLTGTFICGRSMEMTDMESYAKEIRSDPSSPQATLQHWYPRIWDDWARDHDHIDPVGLQFEKKELDLPDETKEIRFKAVIPAFVDDFG